jgi:sugar fermentation stimulation protein A
MKFFEKTLKGRFLTRPNRFTIECALKGGKVRAYLPNPGSLKELLIPNALLYLEKSSNENRTLKYTAVAVEKEGHPISLHTHRTNKVARFLVKRIKREEMNVGRSRFDFLLEKNGKEMLLEVKSCTLFSETVAMFPDAVTTRGKRHIEELNQLSHKIDGAVLFIVNSLHVKYFMPEYHTDLAFTESIFKAREKIKIMAIGVGWTNQLALKKRVKSLEIPWGVVEREAKDRGVYLLILKVDQKTTIEVGSLGRRVFKKGFYIYMGSAKRNLSKRIERHRRMRKRLFWHVDYLRARSQVHSVLPIRTSDDIECEVASAIKEISDEELIDFGSTDCSCNSHLFYFKKDPLDRPNFNNILQYFRMERPLEKIV